MNDTAGASHTVIAQLPVGSEMVDFIVQSRAAGIAAELKKIDVPDLTPSDDRRTTLGVLAENLDGDKLPDVNIRLPQPTEQSVTCPGMGCYRVPLLARQGLPVVKRYLSRRIAMVKSGLTTSGNQDITGAQTVRAEVASEQGSTSMISRSRT